MGVCALDVNIRRPRGGGGGGCYCVTANQQKKFFSVDVKKKERKVSLFSEHLFSITYIFKVKEYEQEQRLMGG